MYKIYIILFASFSIVSCTSDEELTYQQYLVNGEMLYYQKCSNCHGENGEGLKNLYPPLMNSDYLENQENVLCIIKYGASGKMVVNGNTYDQAMPANPKLYDLDIAQLSTWMYHEFQGNRKFIYPDTVKATLLRCQD